MDENITLTKGSQSELKPEQAQGLDIETKLITEPKLDMKLSINHDVEKRIDQDIEERKNENVSEELNKIPIGLGESISEETQSSQNDIPRTEANEKEMTTQPQQIDIKDEQNEEGNKQNSPGVEEEKKEVENKELEQSIETELKGGDENPNPENASQVEPIKEAPKKKRIDEMLIIIRPQDGEWIMSEDWEVAVPILFTIIDLKIFIEENKGIHRHRMNILLKGKLVPPNRETWTLRRLGMYEGYVVTVSPTLSGAWYWNDYDYYAEKLLSRVIEEIHKTSESIDNIKDNVYKNPTNANRILYSQLVKAIQVPPPIQTSLRVFLRKYPERIYIHTEISDGKLWIEENKDSMQLPTFSDIPIELGEIKYPDVPEIDWETHQEFSSLFEIDPEGGDSKAYRKFFVSTSSGVQLGDNKLFGLNEGPSDKEEGANADESSLDDKKPKKKKKDKKEKKKKKKSKKQQDLTKYEVDDGDASEEEDEIVNLETEQQNGLEESGQKKLKSQGEEGKSKSKKKSKKHRSSKRKEEKTDAEEEDDDMDGRPNGVTEGEEDVEEEKDKRKKEKKDKESRKSKSKKKKSGKQSESEMDEGLETGDNNETDSKINNGTNNDAEEDREQEQKDSRDGVSRKEKSKKKKKEKHRKLESEAEGTINQVVDIKEGEEEDRMVEGLDTKNEVVDNTKEQEEVVAAGEGEHPTDDEAGQKSTKTKKKEKREKHHEKKDKKEKKEKKVNKIKSEEGKNREGDP